MDAFDYTLPFNDSMLGSSMTKGYLMSRSLNSTLDFYEALFNPILDTLYQAILLDDFALGGISYMTKGCMMSSSLDVALSLNAISIFV